MEILNITGQSNTGYHTGAPPVGYAPTSSVMILVGDHFEVMRPGVNTGMPNTPDAWGFETEYAARWTQEHPDDTLYVVKTAKGSTGLAQDPHATDWSPESRGELFDANTAALDRARALVGPAHITTLFMQGEQDATSPTAAGAYAVNLGDFLADARTVWGSETLAIGRIDAATGFTFGDAVRTAQDHAGVAVVSTDGLELQADHLHFTGGAQVALGDAFYDALHPVTIEPVFCRFQMAEGWAVA